MTVRIPRAALLPLLLVAGAGTARAQGSVVNDPYLWLEEVQGDSALDWVRAQNARTEAALGAAPGFSALESRIRAILDSDANIPDVSKIGPYYYNFWQDAEHERGIWRRTTQIGRASCRERV